MIDHARWRVHDRQTDVVVEPANHRFRHTEDVIDAQLVYRVRGDQLIPVRTEVPESLVRRGMAGGLVRPTVDRAKATVETALPWPPNARK